MLSGCGMKTQNMFTNGPERIEALERLKQERKFEEDIAHFYPGAPDEEIRAKAEGIINDTLTDLIKIPEQKMSEKEFWKILETAARRLSKMDSEDIDRGLAYMEEIMDIYGIESSEGRLNIWRYGFEPN